jgi:hypothetical protein
MVRFVTQESLKREHIERRKKIVETQLEAGKIKPEVGAHLLEGLNNNQIPHPYLGDKFNLADHIRETPGHKDHVAELISTGSFGANWYQRVRYEVDAGREEVPLVYQPIYDITDDPTLPRTIPIERLGPLGVVFEEVEEGGEIKFASVTESTDSVTIKHRAVGLKYTEDLLLYNEMFRISRMERRFGNAHNAVMNHIHLYPIISASYTGSNATNGTALTTFRADAPMEEKFARTLEYAMNVATDDVTNPRPGPYVLLVGTGAALTARRALLAAPQQGYNIQASPIMDLVTDVIVYRGWTGERGGKPTTYAGVASTDAYLIDVGNKAFDFQSFVKHGLRLRMGEGDASRFIERESLWDSRVGVFANPLRAVHKITLPLADSGVTDA